MQRTEAVTAALFVDQPGFFDAEDRLQVRYEMLRAPAQGEMTVADTCRAFGVSRQTFYVLRRAFDNRGLAGLAEEKHEAGGAAEGVSGGSGVSPPGQGR